MKRKQEDEPPEPKEPDEELLREFEWADEHVPNDAVSGASQDEFEEIWRRIREEHEE